MTSDIKKNPPNKGKNPLKKIKIKIKNHFTLIKWGHK